jgi:hypothetical protein
LWANRLSKNVNCVIRHRANVWNVLKYTKNKFLVSELYKN